MVATKRCAWGTCKNDSRYPHLMNKNENGDLYTFIVSLHRKEHKKTTSIQWITSCHRGDRFVCTKDSYICSLHFVGQNGPTVENPDAISAIASKQKVSYRPIACY